MSVIATTRTDSKQTTTAKKLTFNKTLLCISATCKFSPLCAVCLQLSVSLANEQNVILFDILCDRKDDVQKRRLKGESFFLSLSH